MAANWNILSKYFGVPRRTKGPAKTSVDRIAAHERGRSLAAMNKAKKLAAQYPRISIDRDGPGTYWVTCEGLEGENDPRDGEHFCTDGHEVLTAVEAYVEAITAGN